MGTPDFAVASLEVLINHGKQVVAVVTAVDKAQGRGKKIKSSAVKKYATSLNIPVLQPSNLKSEDLLEELASFKADVFIVVAFRVLPKLVWDMPKAGTFNLHASLLPQYRGAAPINWAIINGEKTTGVTTFRINDNIDTGDIMFQEEEDILASDTAGTLHGRLMKKGAGLVLKTINSIENGHIPSIPQRERTHLQPAPKIYKNDCQIDFQKSTEQVYNFIRGLSPYPGAWFKIRGMVFRVLLALVEKNELISTPGILRTDNQSYIQIGCSDGWISIQELQMQGKRAMSTSEFLRGNSLETGMVQDHD